MKIKATYPRFFKPLLDFFGAIMLIVILSPLFVGIALILALLKQPVLFKHIRPGIQGAPFTMYKFTTLRNGSNSIPFWFGKWLRKTSLDELPQLFNILKGEMSFIGPRPLLMEYLPLYTSEQMRRHCVKPGITGWAQVNGRNLLSIDQKVKLDLYYVKYQSLSLDALIAYKTILQLLKFGEADYHEIRTGPAPFCTFGPFFKRS